MSRSFLVFYADERKKASADKLIQSRFERVAFAYTLAPGGSNFVIAFDNNVEAEEAYDTIRKLERCD